MECQSNPDGTMAITMFRDFEFDGYTFCYVCSKCNEGIETAKYSGGVRITDKEWAMVGSIKDLDKIAGLEEVIYDNSLLHRY